MSENPIHAKEWMSGALIGGLVGGALALLFTSTTGKKIREGICEACEGLHQLSDEALDERASFSQDRDQGSSLDPDLDQELGSEGVAWCQEAKASLEKGAAKTKEWVENQLEEGVSPATLLIGAAVGGSFCFLLGYLLAPKPETELRECLKRILNHSAHEAAEAFTKKREAFVASTRKKSDHGLRFLRHFLHELSREAQSKREALADRWTHSFHRHKKKEWLEWAEWGLSLYKRLSSPLK